tara:strand:+ start:227 stop:1090 length:864 start_codon:yes stop_codon:yes gene_type:complete
MPNSSHSEKIKELRRITGAGFSDCSAAIIECNGDIDESIKYLRVKGISKASKKMSRVANDGLVCIYEKNDKSSIVEINCETDFVAKNIEFLNFSENISTLCINVNGDLNSLKNEKMKDGSTVEENIVKLISKIGEKITIRRCNFFNYNNSKNFSYVHSALKKNVGKIGVLVSIESKKFDEKIDNFGHKLAMHIAATNPLAVDVNNIDEVSINKEKELINEELKNSGKDTKIIEKISKGKLEKYKQENTLLNQYWVMDPKKRVKEVIAELGIENGISIRDFIRYKVGE